MDSTDSTTLTPPDLGWFQNAKFGIFIHWGIYSVGQYEASWSFYNHGAVGQDPAPANPHATVIKLEFAEPLDLYTGHGKVITQN